MNVYPDTAFNNFLHNTRENTPYITASTSFDPETVNPQMEETSQEVQDNTSDYLANIPTSNTNIMDTVDEKIK